MTDRAVSDVVGFVLVFALVVSTIGIVTTVGFSSLEAQENAEQLNNVERAFDVFQNNVEDVYRDGAPSRATEMRLAGGTLRYGDSVNITVRDANDSDVNRTVETTPLIYSSHGTEIVYEGGAVIRDDGHGSVMLNEPPFLLDSDRAVLPLVRTTSSLGPTSISRAGTVRVGSALRNVNTTTRPELHDATDVEIVVESPRNDAWEQYMESNGGSEEPADQGEVAYSFSAADVYVPRFRIQLDYAD